MPRGYTHIVEAEGLGVQALDPGQNFRRHKLKSFTGRYYVSTSCAENILVLRRTKPGICFDGLIFPEPCGLGVLSTSLLSPVAIHFSLGSLVLSAKEAPSENH
jgi:hypothetical protein